MVQNPVELDGLRKAHIRDGEAVVQYLAWLDKQVSMNLSLMRRISLGLQASVLLQLQICLVVM